jgi:CubicO group peptidase (beta-lactamase class C family)
VIAGQPLGDFHRERLFDPLGMADTGFGVPESEVGRLAAMYGLPDLFGSFGFQRGVSVGRRSQLTPPASRRMRLR